MTSDGATFERCAGYRSGLRQPAQQIRLYLRAPERVDLDSLDAWLSRAFGVTPQPLPHPLPTEVAERSAASVAWRCLLTARTLLRLARVPVIEVGRLVRLLPKHDQPGAWEVAAVVPRVDHLPGAITQAAYGASVNLIDWFVSAEGTRDPLSKVQDDVYRDTVLPITTLSQGGISTVPLLQAAYDLDIPFRHLAGGVYQLGLGSRLSLIHRSSVARDSAIGARLSCDKAAAAACLRAAGFPAPEHLLVRDARSGLDAAHRLGWPVVVKPTDRERSEGVTVGIRDEVRLFEAFRAANAVSQKILVEKEVPGICYRLLVADGQLAYAISRRPLAMVADGAHTVAELIEAHNQASIERPPWDRPKRIDLDALTLDALAANGWSPEDMPPSGCQVPVRRIESSEWLGEIADVSAEVHPANADLAVRAARLFGLRTAGIDMISSDIAQPWHANGAVINEVNYAPYFGGNPTARAAMPAYLDRLMTDRGRIPVEVFVGAGAALRNARASQQRYRAAGLRGFLTTHARTWDSDGTEMAVSAEGLFDRALALSMDSRVDALLMVVQTTDLLQTGLPVDRVDRLEDSGEPLAVLQQTDPAGRTRDRRQLLAFLRRYAVSESRELQPLAARAAAPRP